MRALRERVERDGGDALTVVRPMRCWRLGGSRGKIYNWPRRFAYSFVAPDGTEIASTAGGRGRPRAVPAAGPRPPRRGARARGGGRPVQRHRPMTTASGAKFAGLAMRDSAASRRGETPPGVRRATRQ